MWESSGWISDADPMVGFDGIVVSSLVEDVRTMNDKSNVGPKVLDPKEDFDRSSVI